ncbi:Bbp19 family protein [Salidesulfovibrio brasiliensis]|uniref:Bbp19 family protein n=1 Tax=Salidesulfovibrio brasiliensis TaxID=221711 RepID=UPI0006D1168D|nr:hypothetical protein [Salidesulfovibrio brasiliensis]
MLKDKLKTMRDRIFRRHLYRRVFGAGEGREVLKDILLTTRMDLPTYVPGDPTATAYNEGRRAVGLEIFRVLHQDPTEFKETMITGGSDNE